MKPEQFLDIVNHQFNYVYDRTKDANLQKEVVNTCLDVMNYLNFFADPADLDRLIKELKRLNNQ